MSDLNVDAERRICYENYLRIESTVGSTTKNSFLRGICSKHLTRKKFVSCGDRGEVVRLYFYNVRHNPFTVMVSFYFISWLSFIGSKMDFLISIFSTRSSP